MFGDDNVLLEQANPYSVVSQSRNCIIATADTQQFFKLLADAGP